MLFSFFAQAQILFIENDFDKALKEAEQTGKTIFVDAYTDWCGPCQWMQNVTFQSESVGQYYNEVFVCVKMNMDTPNGRQFAQQYSVNAYPTLLYIESNDSLVHREVGAKTAPDLIDLGQLINTNQVLSQYIDGSIPVSGSSIRIPNNNGRFTIGMRGQRLMYGYPYPNSTSHFIAKIDNKFASNNSSFSNTYTQTREIYPKKKIKKFLHKLLRKKPKIKLVEMKRSEKNLSYLIDTLVLTLGGATLISDIDYDFSDVKIRQILTPVNSDLEPAPLDSFGRYIQIKYEFENKSDKTKTIGLAMFFDTMIDNNDACVIEAYNENEDVEKRKKRTRNYETKYTKLEVPDRLLAYQNPRKKTKELTGDFLLARKDATKPHEVYIGSWGYLYGVQWLPRSKASKKYFDSGIFLKWKDLKLKAKEKKIFIIYYGSYSPRELEIIPSNTKVYGHDRDGQKIIPDEYIFDATELEIWKGEKTTLKWSSTNTRGATIKIAEMNYENQDEQDKKITAEGVENIGELECTPEESKIYQLIFEKDGKVIQTLNVIVTVNEKILPERIPMNGQFTLGYDDIPILYGYPHNFSNSYYTINYQNQAFTNSIQQVENYSYRTFDCLKYPEAELADLTKLYDTIPNLAIQQSVFKVENVNDANFDYYNIQYKLTNLSDKAMKIDNFSIVNDFNFASFDDCSFSGNAKKIPQNSLLLGEFIPKELNLISDKKEKIAILYGKNNLIFPKSLFIGHWQEIQKNDLEVLKYKEDSGLKQTWNFSIEKKDSVNVGYTLKVPKGKELVYEYNSSVKENSENIYFKENKAELSEGQKKKIKYFIAKNEYKFVIINAYTDFTGTNKKNYEFSIKRSEAVKEYILSIGVNKESILIKNNGETYAKQYKDKSKIKNDKILRKDRKVEIVLYK